MKLLLASLAGAVIGGFAGLVGPIILGAIIGSSIMPWNFLWTAPLGILFGAAVGLAYTGKRQGPG